MIIRYATRIKTKDSKGAEKIPDISGFATTQANLKLFLIINAHTGYDRAIPGLGHGKLFPVAGVCMAEKYNGDSPIVFDGVATIRTIDALHVRLADALCAQDHLQIDVSGLTEVDISFIQLVLAARKSARRDGKRLSLAAPADGVLRDSLILGGFLAPDGQPHPGTDFWLNTETVQ
jgi:ABC-type transporter Mla MlaB component